MSSNLRYELELQQDDQGLNEQDSTKLDIDQAIEQPIAAKDTEVEDREQELAQSSSIDNDVPASGFKRELRRQQEIRGLKSDEHIRTRPTTMSVPGLPESLTEDLTQKSAMSPTQANSESLYEQFPIHQQEEERARIAKQQHSVVTESTARTYGENDTGHVNFDSYMPAADEHTDDASQDASFAPEVEDNPEKSYEPRTPAPAVNPFTYKGSVMRGHEMFGATQPSSIGRQLPSGVSSRPSPDVYNGFTSPIKQMPLASSPPPSSPLIRRSDTSPLQSSVRNILRSKSVEEQSLLAPLQTRTEQTQCSDGGQKLSSSFPAMQPRQYIPMNQSQEHRIQPESSIPHSDPEDLDSDSDIDIDDIAQRKRLREAKTRRQLSEVSMQRTDVEVPSTGRKERRRSIQEDYLAQCSGLDAIYTQSQTQTQPPTQEFIADSQTVELPTFSTAQTHVPESESEGRVPASKIQSDVGLIPETSPPSSEHNAPILPMGDIASLSFGGETQDIDAPGFTQDIGFEEVMAPFSSREPSQSPLIRREVVPPKNTVLEGKGLHDVTRDSTAELSHKNQTLAAEVDLPVTNKQLFAGSIITGAEDKSALVLEKLPTRKEIKAPIEEVKVINAPTFLDGVAVIKSTGPPEDEPTVNDEASNEVVLVSDTLLSITKLPVAESTKVVPLKSSRKGKFGTPAFLPPTPRRSARANPKSTSRSAMPASRSSRPSSASSTSLSPVPSLLPSPVTNSSPSVVGTTKPKKKRKSTITQSEPVSTRTSKRKPAPTRDSSADPLAGPTIISAAIENDGIFSNMAFAISYVKQSKEKDNISKAISANGGQILEDGFGVLFEPLTLRNQETDLSLSSIAQSIGFVALIADEHSRKAKYIEALALGLPCLSGRWVEVCATKGQLVSWAPYLLCAGHSSFLNAFPSRMLQPYSAANAKFVETFAQRERMLSGLSILLVTGKGHTAEARKAYVFLTRILGPSQLVQVVDCESARKKLLEYEEQNQPCDFVYVDNEKTADVSIFGPTNGSKSKKRKSRATDIATPAPKRIRMVNDEVIVQSLIVGQFLEEYL